MGQQKLIEQAAQRLAPGGALHIAEDVSEDELDAQTSA